MRGGQVAVGVLTEVQMLNQKIAAARAVAHKRADLGPCGIVKLAPLRRSATFASAGFPDTFAIVEGHIVFLIRAAQNLATF